MHCLNIAVGNISWRLLFKDAETANVAWEACTRNLHGAFNVQDDFGQKFSAERSAIHAVLLEDLDAAKPAHVELILQQERVRTAAVKGAQADPSLRQAMAPGPGIINPMGNGHRPF